MTNAQYTATKMKIICRQRAVPDGTRQSVQLNYSQVAVDFSCKSWFLLNAAILILKIKKRSTAVKNDKKKTGLNDS